MAGSKVYITLEVDDKGSATMKKFGGNTDAAFDKLKKNANAGAAQAGKMERAWKTSIDHLKAHWKAYAIGGVAAIYGVTKMISGAIDKMKEYVGLANIQEAAEKKLEAVLRATGNAAGYNLDQLKNMASGMQAVTTVGDEVILSGMAILATFKQIKGEGFERATKAALDMSAVMGQDLKSSMVMIGKAVNDPITGMSMLTRVGVTFTQQQKDMAKQMQESGDMAGAQNVILKELESQFGGTAAALREDFGGAVTAAGNALGDTKEEMGFLITKNQFFIDIVHLAEKQFIAWGEKIKENRGYLQDLLKSGVLKLVDGITFTIKVMRFFHQGWQGIKLVGTAAIHAIAVGLDELLKGIRFLFAPLDAIFEGLKKLGIIKVNPFDQIEKALGQFRASSADVTQDVLKDIAKTNKTYDLVIDKVEGWQKQIKAIPVEQAKTEKQITKSLKTIGKKQVTATKEQTKAAEDFSKKYQKLTLGDYKYAEQQLRAQARAYEDAGEDHLQVEKWLSAEITKLANKTSGDKTKAAADFSEKYQKLTLGDYKYAEQQLRAQARAYEDAGEDHLQVEKWLSAEITKLANKTSGDKTKAAEDYAKESTKIYERMFDDIQKLDLGDYGYNLQLLNKRYDNHKTHLESLAGQDSKYSDGVMLLDKWLGAEKQKLWDDWARKHGTVLDRMAVRWRDYQKEAIDTNKIAYDAISAGAANLEKQLSDNFFNVITGNMDKVKFDWDSMWKSMVRSTTDHMARIVTETALNTASKAVGAGMDWLGEAMGWWAAGSWEIKKQHMAMLHPGEMVIPADMADKVRGSSANGNVGLGEAMSPEASITVPGSLRGVAENRALMSLTSSARGFAHSVIANLALGGKVAVNPLGVLGVIARAGYQGYQGMKDMEALWSNVYGNTQVNWDATMNSVMQDFYSDVLGQGFQYTGQQFAVNSFAAGRGGSGDGDGSVGGFGGQSSTGMGADGTSGGMGGTYARSGGLFSRPTIMGEAGPEWAVPTYEPERSRFLKDVGADPDKLAASIANKLGGRSGGGITINGPLVSVEGDNHVFDDQFIEKLTRSVRTELRNLEALRH